MASLPGVDRQHGRGGRGEPSLAEAHQLPQHHTGPIWSSDFESHLAGELRLGRLQVRRLAPLASLGIATSGYNEAELVEAGYPSTVVVAPLVDLSPRAEADALVASRLGQERERGCSVWLFVGQLLPHKGQHALIEALAFYRAAYEPNARLHLVGRETSSDYAGALRRLVGALGLGDVVEFEGSVSESELAAFYAGADVFVGCSSHEGFCAPLIEAMHHRLPVIAFGAAAASETIGEAGLVLPGRSPSLVAAAVHRVLSDQPLRTRIVDAGSTRAPDFALERSRTAFARAVRGSRRVRVAVVSPRYGTDIVGGSEAAMRMIAERLVAQLRLARRGADHVRDRPHDVGERPTRRRVEARRSTSAPVPHRPRPNHGVRRPHGTRDRGSGAGQPRRGGTVDRPPGPSVP